MFPKNGANVPEVRFPGFTDPWEQRKLGEICSFSKGRGYSKDDLRESGTPIILYGRLYTQYETRIKEVDTFATEGYGSMFSVGNEVIVPASGETAEDIAVASSVRSAGIILGGDLNIVRPDRRVDQDFLALGITYGRTHRELSKRAQGKSVVHLHGTDIAEVDFAFPSREEQSAIASAILAFDDLIALHQRKLDHLKLQKKALLQQMFV
ncbi:restriction endonuclease subunit S [Collinsella intestinalis]|nr:restriction endonuclease subunit S [Collinsella intestinalis]